MSNECRISKSIHVYYYGHEVFLFEYRSSAIHIQEFYPWPKKCFLLRLTRYLDHDPIHITILITLGKIVFLWSVRGSQKKTIVMPVDCHTPSWHLCVWLWSSGQNKFEFIIMLTYIHWLQYHKQLNLYFVMVSKLRTWRE